MNAFKFFLSLGLTLGLVYLLSVPHTLGSDSADGASSKSTLPPLGSFFSPFDGFWRNAEPQDAFASQNFEIPNLKGSVSVLMDERLVPHIFAANMADAAFAQGFVTAKYRLFQMDLISRLSSGRLSEVLGEKTLATDKLTRRQGMVYGARKAAEAWKEAPEIMEVLQAYADGVNAYIDQLCVCDYPLEFKLLNYKPERWSVMKTALVKKYMDKTLCFGEDDVEATNALQQFGREVFDKLYPLYNPKQSPVIPAGTPWNFEPIPVDTARVLSPTESIGFIDMHVGDTSTMLEGSNNWAVSGSKTASGYPILCNDPHLRLTLPSIWFETQIHTNELNAYGVTVPGFPGVLIGFNEHIAWGETNVGQDANDWYQIQWTDDSKTAYYLDGKIHKADLVVEQYRVKGLDEPVLDTVRWTYWGPVVYDDGSQPWNGMAMHWIGHETPSPTEMLTFFGLMKARNYDEYYDALRNYSFPAQNFAFASTEGDIAITVNGSYPVKTHEQGRFVQDGSSTANAWHAWIPYEHRARIKNPDRGFVSSANQHSTDPTYPYYYHSVHFDDFRGRYINMRLAEMDQISKEDLMGLQNDNRSLQAIEGLPAMLANVDESQLDQRELRLLEQLKSWNHSFDADKVEPIIFLAWFENCYGATFDEVSAVATPERPMMWPEDWLLIQMLEESPDDVFFDDQRTLDQTETARDIVTASFKNTVKDLVDRLMDPDFNWSKQKGTSIMHLAQIPAFSAMNLHVGGYKQAPNAISESHGPSWRMVVALEPGNVRGWGVFPGGQSGNPGSPFYKTGLEKWLNGEYYELNFVRNMEALSDKQLFEISFNK